MRIELDGTGLLAIGENGPVAAAIREALLARGARPAGDGATPRLLLAGFPLVPTPDADLRALVAETEAIGEAMKPHGGRVLMLLSAAADLPMRRHGGYSAQMALCLAAMRAMAMRLAPQVLVNALGVGLIGEGAPLAGDAAMAGHAAMGRAGTLDEAVGAALFLCDPANSYTTGQMLRVDGGWSAGYGRSF